MCGKRTGLHRKCAGNCTGIVKVTAIQSQLATGENCGEWATAVRTCVWYQLHHGNVQDRTGYVQDCTGNVQEMNRIMQEMYRIVQEMYRKCIGNVQEMYRKCAGNV